MATGDGSTQWIEIADFTKGIHASNRSISSNNPEAATDGVARIQETWGCIANPNGGLEAGPRLVYTETKDFKPSVPERVTGAPTNSRILDMAVSQMTHYGDPTFDANGEVQNPNDCVWMMSQNFKDSGALNHVRTRTWRWERNNPSPPVALPFMGDFQDNITAATKYRWGRGSITFAKHSMEPVTFLHNIEYPPRSRTVFQYSNWNDNSKTWTGGLGQIFPRVTSFYDDGIQAQFPLPTKPFHVVWHQQRLVWSVAEPNYDGTTADDLRDAYDNFALEDLMVDEQLNYLPVYNLNEVFWGVGDSLMVDAGRPDSIGAMISVNTNELYIVKAQGGGIIVRDSLERPSVNRYAGVESTGAFPHKPVLVPGLGVVYGGTGGVFAWNGGNASKQLSASLDGLMWVTPDNLDGTDFLYRTNRNPQTPVGRFAYQHPFIYAPNNWIMDVRTGGWFRLHPTTTDTAETSAVNLAHFDVSATGQIYAAPSEQPTSGTHTSTAWLQFNPRRGANKYSWRSQPLARTLHGRQLEFRELDIVVMGAGTVTFSLVGHDGVASTKSIGPFNYSRPVLHRVVFDTRAYDVEARIVSEGATASSVAPTVLRFSLGYKETNQSGRG